MLAIVLSHPAFFDPLSRRCLDGGRLVSGRADRRRIAVDRGLPGRPALGEREVDPPHDLSLARRHDVFVSYASDPDAFRADHLRRGLQRLGRPVWRLGPQLKVYLDQAEMAASNDLWAEICRAIDGSDWFVLLASPQSAESPWVGREIARWLKTRGADRLLVVVTAGTHVWDREGGDFDFVRSTALHRELAGAFDEEPRLVDMRNVDNGRLTLQDPDFMNVVAEVGAAIHGVSKTELAGAELRERRRTRRLLQATVGILVVLLAVAVAAGGVAVRELRQSEQARRLALSRLLVTQSDQLAVSDPGLAMHLAATAWDFAPLPEAHAAMRRRLAQPLVGVLRPPRGAVDSALFNPDESLLAVSASSSYDTPFRGSTVTVWDVVERRQRGEPLVTVDGRAWVAAFGPGDLLVVVVEHEPRTVSEVQVWDARARRQVGENVPLPGPVNLRAAAFSPDGRTLALASSAVSDFSVEGTSVEDTEVAPTVAFWDVATRQPVGSPVRQASGVEVTGLDYSDDGSILAVVTSLGAVELWDAASHRRTRIVAPEPPTAFMVGVEERVVDINPQATALVTAGASGVRLWDLGEDQPVAIVLAEGESYVAGFSADGFQVFGGVGSEIRSWDALTGRRTGSPLGGVDSGDASVLDVGGRGRYLVSSTGSGTSLRLWDVERYRQMGRALPINESFSTGATLRFSPDGSLLASRDEGDLLRFWDAVTYEPVGAPLRLDPGSSPEVDALVTMGWAPDGDVVATSGNDGTIRVWDVATRREMASFTNPGEGMWARTIADGVAFSHDGRFVAAAWPDIVRVWEVPTGKLHAERALPTGTGPNDMQWPGRVWFGPDDDALYLELDSVEVPGLIRRWDLTTQQLGRAQPIGHGAFISDSDVSLDGRFYAAATEAGAVHVWRLDDMQEIYTYDAGAVPAIIQVAINHDGTLIAHELAMGSNAIRLVSIPDGEEVAQIAVTDDEAPPEAGDFGGLWDMTFHPSDDRLAVLDDSLIRTWRLPLTEDLLTELCRDAGTPATTAEWERYVGHEERRSPCEQR